MDMADKGFEWIWTFVFASTCDMPTTISTFVSPNVCLFWL